MLKIMIASFLNRIRRPSHSCLWNISFSLALSVSNTFMSSIGGCQELDFLPEILYPWSAATIELIGHLQQQNTRKKKDVKEEGRISASKEVIALIPKEVKSITLPG